MVAIWPRTAACASPNPNVTTCGRRFQEDLCGDPLVVWRNWADEVRGGPMDCGHHILEEVPEALGAESRVFLAACYR